MTEREALKLGIESLEWHNQHMHRKISEQAIAAMKEALAQPEQDWIERERAVGYREGHQNALKQMAQPEQEPVACVEYIPCCTDQTCPKCKAATPPQRTWVGLTDSEIGTIAYNVNPLDGIRQFSRAVEAKLKEKNT